MMPTGEYATKQSKVFQSRQSYHIYLSKLSVNLTSDDSSRLGLTMEIVQGWCSIPDSSPGQQNSFFPLERAHWMPTGRHGKKLNMKSKYLLCSLHFACCTTVSCT